MEQIRGHTLQIMERSLEDRRQMRRRLHQIIRTLLSSGWPHASGDMAHGNDVAHGGWQVAWGDVASVCCNMARLRLDHFLTQLDSNLIGLNY